MEVLARKENTVFVQRKVLRGGDIRRGDIMWVDFGTGSGSEQNGIRPAIIIQNNIGNKYSPTVIVAPITSQINKAKLPTHVEIKSSKYGLSEDSVLLAEQIRTIDKTRISSNGYIGSLDNIDLDKLNYAISISLGLEVPVARTNNKVMNG